MKKKFAAFQQKKTDQGGHVEYIASKRNGDESKSRNSLNEVNRSTNMNHLSSNYRTPVSTAPVSNGKIQVQSRNVLETIKGLKNVDNIFHQSASNNFAPNRKVIANNLYENKETKKCDQTISLSHGTAYEQMKLMNSKPNVLLRSPNQTIPS